MFKNKSVKSICCVLSVPFMLALASSAALAEGKVKPHAANSGASCTVENRDHNAYSPPQVIEFGDLKIKTVEEGGQAGGTHYAIFDLKAPNYLKRGVRLKESEIFTDTICGSEVSIQMRGWSTLRVSSF